MVIQVFIIFRYLIFIIIIFSILYINHAIILHFYKVPDYIIPYPSFFLFPFFRLMLINILLRDFMLLFITLLLRHPFQPKYPPLFHILNLVINLYIIMHCLKFFMLLFLPFYNSKKILSFYIPLLCFLWNFFIFPYYAFYDYSLIMLFMIIPLLCFMIIPLWLFL